MLGGNASAGDVCRRRVNEVVALSIGVGRGIHELVGSGLTMEVYHGYEWVDVELCD